MRVGHDFQAAIPELVSESKFMFMLRFLMIIRILSSKAKISD